MEICAGGGGQALGLEQGGFEHELVAEIDRDATRTLRFNRPNWRVFEGDIRELNGRDFRGIDLFAGGVPCPPFSVAGKQLGSDDERDLFPEALRLISESRPRAVLLENVRGLASARFADYRTEIRATLERLGYQSTWQLITSSEHGVPQLRPRFVLVALQARYFAGFGWPAPSSTAVTVGETIGSLMAARGWSGAAEWARKADGIGPTIVGGSRKHGGADLGPSRAKLAWSKLGVDGKGIVSEAPGPDAAIEAIPRLTLEMVACLQGFPSSWKFQGLKTSAYRQIGNAFPPPVASALGRQVALALRAPMAPSRVNSEIEIAAD